MLPVLQRLNVCLKKFVTTLQSYKTPKDFPLITFREKTIIKNLRIKKRKTSWTALQAL